MRRIATTILLVSIPLAATFADSRLLGKWKSDKEATVQFLNKHAKVTDDALAILAQIAGSFVLTFESDMVSVETKDVHIRIDDQTELIKGMSMRTPYEVIGSDKNSVAVMTRMKHAAPGELDMVVFNFLSPARMWMLSSDKDISFSAPYVLFFRREE